MSESVHFSGFYIGAFGEYMLPTKASCIFDGSNERLAKKYRNAIHDLEKIAWQSGLELPEILPMTKVHSE